MAVKVKTTIQEIISRLASGKIVATLVDNALPESARASVLHFKYGNLDLFLKIYEEKDSAIALHEKNGIAYISQYKQLTNLLVPSLPEEIKIITDIVEEVSVISGKRFHYVLMEGVKGQPLGASLSSDIVCSILCDVVDILTVNTIGWDVKPTKKRLHFGQGIFTWVSDEEGIIPLISFYDHRQEFAALIEKQNIFPKKRLSDCLSKYENLIDTSIKRPSFAHNDLHIYNVLKTKKHLGLVDFACSNKTSPLADFGGVLAHVGLDKAEYVLNRAKAIVRFCEIEEQFIEDQISFFCLKRALRRIVFLENSFQHKPDFFSDTSILEKPIRVIDNLI